MLWFKGWLETRFRLLFVLGFVGSFLVSVYSGVLKPPAGVEANGVAIAPILVAMMSFMLAGAGIYTQPSLQATKGLHGSTLFTLSLPVSRLRLLAVRASLGWLEITAGIGLMCCGMWILFPALRGTATAVEMLEYAVVLITCASGLHFISVLLATFLDDQWRVWGSMIAFGALWWLSNRSSVPASANIFRAMGDGSPLLAHTMPWTAMALSVGMAAILFVAAWRVVQVREY
jgi:hypothetical protein